VYTQCSKCETVFKLSPETLRVAGGQVRCGKCGEVFNALARLAEDATGFAINESAQEQEARADSILESVVPPHVEHAAATDEEEFAPPGVEIARLEILDWPDEDATSTEDSNPEPDELADRSMEFTLPPGELDRIFVESKKQRLPPLRQQSAAHAQPQPVAQPQPAAPVQPATQAPAPESKPDLPPHPESVVAEPAARSRVSGFEVPEDVRREMMAGFEEFIRPAATLEDAPTRNADRTRLIAWASAAAVFALLLMAQVVHHNREWLLVHTHGPLGAVMRALYGAMGAPLPAPPNLSAYQLRQWGVTGDPAANGTLRLRASILNAAAQLQPYPLLRVTLADRFGKSIGRRDFEAAEYLGKPTARLLAPGERADATLDILDPGKNAEGFEIDVCLRGVDQRISCANDVAAQSKP
jgi:predicted Zn finger-like uncharacterized protein